MDGVVDGAGNATFVWGESRGFAVRRRAADGTFTPTERFPSGGSHPGVAGNADGAVAILGSDLTAYLGP